MSPLIASSIDRSAPIFTSGLNEDALDEAKEKFLGLSLLIIVAFFILSLQK
jgi:hypothetical protein